MQSLPVVLMLAFAGCLIAGCGSGELQRQEEAVKVQWSEAVHLYERRSDLVPAVLDELRALGLADTPELSRVEEAWAGAKAQPPTPALLDDVGAFARSQAAQLNLRAALAGLTDAVDLQPRLAAAPGYRDLRTQLKDTERRIAQVRLRYAEAAHGFNTAIQRFPARLTAGLFDLAAVPSMARVDSADAKLSSAPAEPGRPVASN
jgi:LemA protein